MRLWHKDLIPVLPKQQLLGQWRECCCIARNIAVNGTPNHLLVNKIMDYPIDHFYSYTYLVARYMFKRGYKLDWGKFARYIDVGKLKSIDVTVDLNSDGIRIDTISSHLSHDELFAGWHNDRYLLQCFYNLQEKFDCGGITEAEWRYFQEGVKAIWKTKDKHM